MSDLLGLIFLGKNKKLKKKPETAKTSVCVRFVELQAFMFVFASL